MNVQKKDTNFLGTFNSRTKIPIVKKEDGKQECKKTRTVSLIASLPAPEKRKIAYGC